MFHNKITALPKQTSWAFAIWKSKVLQNPKPFECLSKCPLTPVMSHSQTAGLRNILYKKLTSVHNKVQTRYKWIVCLDLSPTLKIPHYMYANIPKSKTFLLPGISGRECRTCIFQLRLGHKFGLQFYQPSIILVPENVHPFSLSHH